MVGWCLIIAGWLLDDCWQIREGEGEKGYQGACQGPDWLKPRRLQPWGLTGASLVATWEVATQGPARAGLVATPEVST